MKRKLQAAFGLSVILPYIAVTSIITGCSDQPAPHNPPAELPAELPAKLQADLQATLDQAVADGSIPGVALYVSGQDGTWSGAAGIANIEGDVPMAPENRFRTGSILKTLVATAVLQAVEKGTLGLHDVLTDHLPAGVTSKIPNADIIDVEMLLGHRSGIPEWVTVEVKQVVVTEPGHIWSLDEILGAIEGQPPVFSPGETFGYSNTNYVLLGEILSAVEGRNWREVVRERVIARAGMTEATLPDPGDVECPACAHGYVAMDNKMFDGTNVDPSMAGASGGHALISTNADLARMLEQLRAGALFDRAETLDTMFAFQPALNPQEHLTGYGLGVMQFQNGNDVAIGHLGGTAGYSGFMLYIPTTDRYVSGFMNIMGDPTPVILPVLTRLAQPE